MSILTDDLIDRFAIVLKAKLEAADRKYGYRDAWVDAGWEDECRADMISHIEKGDPRDVAIYAAFMWHHQWNTNDKRTV